MSAPAHHATDNHATEVDGVEAIVPLMPIVLPLVGANCAVAVGPAG